MMSFEQDAAGVRAVIRDLRSGEESLLRADYLIAADGSGSSTRKHLGIPVHGPGALWQAVTVLFEADLQPALRGRRVFVAWRGDDASADPDAALERAVRRIIGRESSAEPLRRSAVSSIEPGSRALHEMKL